MVLLLIFAVIVTTLGIAAAALIPSVSDDIIMCLELWINNHACIA